MPSVLVVDDDRMMRILVTRTLKAEGFEVRVAENATEARLELTPKGSRVLRKPFMPAELVRVVREALRS
jgi:DNA-binding NtrC family response regulator